VPPSSLYVKIIVTALENITLVVIQGDQAFEES
jgi:hypothetical protein